MDVIGLLMWIMVLGRLVVVATYIDIDESCAKYAASAELFTKTLLVALASCFVIPLIIAPLMKILWRQLKKFVPTRETKPVVENAPSKSGSTRTGKVVAWISTGATMTYAVITMVISWQFTGMVQSLSFEEKRLTMQTLAPEICSLLWQSWAVLAAIVVAFFLLVGLYFEFEAPEDKEDASMQNDDVAVACQPNN